LAGQADSLPQLRSSPLSADELSTAIGEFMQQLLINSGAGAAVVSKYRKNQIKQERGSLT
jgi:hypothetical protein